MALTSVTGGPRLKKMAAAQVELDGSIATRAFQTIEIPEELLEGVTSAAEFDEKALQYGRNLGIEFFRFQAPPAVADMARVEAMEAAAKKGSTLSNSAILGSVGLGSLVVKPSEPCQTCIEDTTSRRGWLARASIGIGILLGSLAFGAKRVAAGSCRDFCGYCVVTSACYYSYPGFYTRCYQYKCRVESSGAGPCNNYCYYIVYNGCLNSCGLG